MVCGWGGEERLGGVGLGEKVAGGFNGALEVLVLVFSGA